MLLVVSLLPGLPELAESVEHLVHDGHMPHSDMHEREQHAESHDGLNAEHGCTPLSHQCSCHTSQPCILGEESVVVRRVLVSPETRAVEAVELPTLWANAPPTRPPIA